MKKTLFLSLFFGFLLFAQDLKAADDSTGITPYVFYQVWEAMDNGVDVARGEKILLNRGYKKLGTYENMIGYNMVYAKAANVKVGTDGFVKSATPGKGSGYSSYIQVGPGVGMDWAMSVTFLTKAGTDAFIKLLKKAGYTKHGTAWKRADGLYFFQRERTFSVSSVADADDF